MVACSATLLEHILASMRIDATTRALVTGASRGIGRALAGGWRRAAPRSGCSRAPADELEALAAELGPRAVGWPPTSVTAARSRRPSSASSSRRAGSTSSSRTRGSLTTVRCGAGVERVEAMTRVNWLGTRLHGQGHARALVDRAIGHIVIVSSGAGLRAFPWAAATAPRRPPSACSRRHCATSSRLRRVGHHGLPGRDRHPSA